MTASQIIGKPVSFDHEGKRLSGIITDAVKAPNTTVGNIPDFTVTIRGRSGKTITTSFVEAYSSVRLM